MNLVGYPYTWERGFGSDAWIAVRLYRAPVNMKFLNMFKDAKLISLEITTSDHYLLMLEHTVSVNISWLKDFILTTLGCGSQCVSILLRKLGIKT